MAVLSVHPETFDDQHVAAFEWLSRAVTLALWTQDRAHRTLDLQAVYVDAKGPSTAPVGEIANDVIEELERLRIQLLQLTGNVCTQQQVDALRGRLRDLQASVAVLMGRTSHDPLRFLTAREREIVQIITSEADPGNRAIARRLGLAETTVKTHVAHALEKLGLDRRAEIKWLLGQQQRP